MLDAIDFFVSEAALSGESVPVQERPGVVDVAAALALRTDCAFTGTNVRSPEGADHPVAQEDVLYVVATEVQKRWFWWFRSADAGSGLIGAQTA